MFEPGQWNIISSKQVILKKLKLATELENFGFK